MTKLEALFVAQRINIEGSFNYALTSYSSFPAVKDEEFHKLRKQYVDNQNPKKPHVKGVYHKLRKMILEAAQLKSFSDQAIDAKWSDFTKEEMAREDIRWELEFKKYMLESYKKTKSEYHMLVTKQAIQRLEEEFKQ